jgi:hypothetical protein
MRFTSTPSNGTRPYRLLLRRPEVPHIQYRRCGNRTDNPFRKPHYLLINLALGGAWGGEIDDAVLPQKYLIDYVRCLPGAVEQYHAGAQKLCFCTMSAFW